MSKVKSLLHLSRHNGLSLGSFLIIVDESRTSRNAAAGGDCLQITRADEMVEAGSLVHTTCHDATR